MIRYWIIDFEDGIYPTVSIKASWYLYCNKRMKDLSVGFLDYEKAFNYVNRAKIIQKLI